MLRALFEENLDVAEELWERNRETLQRLRNASALSEPLRLWVSKTDPSETCGLLFVCQWMMDYDTPMSVVYVPQELEQKDEILFVRGTGEIPPEKFGDLVQYEEHISASQKSAYARIWGDLVQEKRRCGPW